MDKLTLAKTLRYNRALFERIVAQISEQRMLEALDDGMSGKDIVAHITTWEQRLVRWLEATVRGETPAPPRPPVSRSDIDMLNALSLAENKERSLQEVMEHSRRTFARVLELLEGFSEQELLQPDRYAWISETYDGRALWRVFLAGPGYAHYQDHFYDLLRRADPSVPFAPTRQFLQKFVGTYEHSHRGELTFRIGDDDSLVVNVPKRGELSGIALDETHFVYPHFGTVIFHVNADGSVPTLEWWARIYRRREV